MFSSFGTAISWFLLGGLKASEPTGGHLLVSVPGSTGVPYRIRTTLHRLSPAFNIKDDWRISTQNKETLQTNLQRLEDWKAVDLLICILVVKPKHPTGLDTKLPPKVG